MVHDPEQKKKKNWKKNHSINDGNVCQFLQYAPINHLMLIVKLQFFFSVFSLLSILLCHANIQFDVHLHSFRSILIVNTWVFINFCAHKTRTLWFDSLFFWLFYFQLWFFRQNREEENIQVKRFLVNLFVKINANTGIQLTTRKAIAWSKQKQRCVEYEI